jgi:hypothetical protein
MTPDRPESSREELRLEPRHRRFGWSLVLVGILYGMAFGLFAFDGPLPAPAGLADYASLPRRLTRLAHIACIALGLINIQYGHEIDRLRLSASWRRIGSAAMIAAGALMPALLTMAAFDPRWKWGLPIPATAALVGVSVIVAGIDRRTS